MSDYTLTVNYGLKKPTIAADNDAWGGHWNENADAIDALIKTRIDGLNGVFLPLNSAPVASRTAAGTMNLSGFAISVVIARWSDASLLAPARYKRVASEPSHPGKVQDATGAWFEIDEAVISPEMFGALADGITGDQMAFTNAIAVQRPIRCMSAHYHFTARANVPNNGTLMIEGGLQQRSLFTGATDLLLFVRDTTIFASFINTINLRHLAFDGQRVRSHGFPYSANTNTDAHGFLMPFQLAADPDSMDSSVEMNDCAFINCVVAPYQFFNYRRATVRDCWHSRTADPGFIACHEIEFTGNYHEFGSDNGVSVSRGCLRAVVTNNVFKDPEIAGMWFSGFDIAGGGTLTATGVYTPTGTVNVVASINSFSAYQKGTLITLEDAGGVQCTLKIMSITDGTHLTASVITQVPVGLQGIASTNWWFAPLIGTAQFIAANNHIIGANQAGVHAAIAAHNGNIHDNHVNRTGVIADSEVSDTVTIGVGTPTATVTTGAKFPIGSWVLIEPRSSYSDYFIAQVNAVAGNVLTLDRNAPRTYAGEVIYLAHLTPDASYVFYAVGASRGGQHLYGEDITFRDNIVADYVGYGAYLGSTAGGSVRAITIEGNKFRQPRGVGSATLAFARISEYPAAPGQDIIIVRNQIDSANPLIEAYQRGAAVRRWCLGPNFQPFLTSNTPVSVKDLDNASADISAQYQHARTDDKGITRTTFSKINGWVAATNVGGVVDVASEALLVTPATDLETITSFTYLYGGASGLPRFVVRNASPTNRIRLVNNSGLLRTGVGEDVTLQPDQVGHFAFINGTIVALLNTGLDRVAPAMYQNKPSPPAGMSSTAAAVMMGLAGMITPTRSGRVYAVITGVLSNNTGATGSLVNGRYGTGTAPANGAALAGTLFAGNQRVINATGVTNMKVPFAVSGIMGITTRLTPGTPYWIDASLVCLIGGTALIEEIQITAYEI